MPEVQPTERELEALKVLWECGEASVREVCDALNKGGESLAYTTVLSLLQVMEQKGLVTHRSEGKAYIYLPAIARENTLRQLATGFLDRVFDGALDEYLVHALGKRRITADEIAQLEAMLAEAKEKSPGKKKGKQP
ncbi:BlaI/MecI/CopY family transcriptional regulator [Bythopirellula polymerisocia]|uniref:Penicillinase repressor n=1 Tax=Bythopirellula polymerisocia TaxID=2528003 RepID=A0A5C6CF86_9BACT|nr:BlaI/MecI/CopY family transcriptional regulator [Bythopirellula polymerisocia]TWU21966.1 Penicillinase repressor [Bythopirellula polymerisocia]